MTLDKVIESLSNTIAGKEEMLKGLLTRDTLQNKVTASFLAINIKELWDIMDDLIMVRDNETKPKD